MGIQEEQYLEKLRKLSIMMRNVFRAMQGGVRLPDGMKATASNMAVDLERYRNEERARIQCDGDSKMRPRVFIEPQLSSSDRFVVFVDERIYETDLNKEEAELAKDKWVKTCEFWDTMKSTS